MINSDYIECLNCKSKPWKHFQVCMVCRRRKSCHNFNDWLTAELTPEADYNGEAVKNEPKKSKADPARFEKEHAASI